MGRLFNVLTAMFFVLAFLVVIGLVVVFLAPGLLEGTPLAGLVRQAEPEPVIDGPIDVPTLAPIAIVPTPLPTATPNLLQPTWTPLAAALPPTNEPLATLGPTLTPSVTPVFPSRTPTKTATPTPTNTPTETPPGPPPTASPTRSEFIFTRSDISPFYLQNFANNAGCEWMGIAGEVLDLNRNPVAAGSYRVHVWGSGIDQRVSVGSAPDYSPSGWEQFLFNSPTIRDYNVQLETASGTAVSQVYSVQTRSSCNQNLVRFDFVQNH
ncbi:MAG: hypothetical protein KC425_18770 [Anaerolineales bacterium]|nr:hypothetical protein [Anaerolineales bacterium]